MKRLDEASAYTKREPTSDHEIDGFSAQPILRHTCAHIPTKVMCMITSVSEKWNLASESSHLLKRMMVEERKIHCTMR